MAAIGKFFLAFHIIARANESLERGMLYLVWDRIINVSAGYVIKFCLQIAVTNMATVRNVEIIFNKFRLAYKKAVLRPK
jgi:hypothetical protein